MPVSPSERRPGGRPLSLGRRRVLRGLVIAPAASVAGVLAGCSEPIGSPEPVDPTPGDSAAPTPTSSIDAGSSATGPALPDDGLLADVETDLLLLEVLTQRAGRTHRELRPRSRAIAAASREQRLVLREARGAPGQDRRRPSVAVPPSADRARALVQRRVRVTRERIVAGAQTAQDGQIARLLASIAASLSQQETLW